MTWSVERNVAVETRQRGWSLVVMKKGKGFPLLRAVGGAWRVKKKGIPARQPPTAAGCSGANSAAVATVVARETVAG